MPKRCNYWWGDFHCVLPPHDKFTKHELEWDGDEDDD